MDTVDVNEYLNNVATFIRPFSTVTRQGDALRNEKRRPAQAWESPSMATCLETIKILKEEFGLEAAPFNFAPQNGKPYPDAGRKPQFYVVF